MRFTETALSGVLVVEGEPHADERGAFVRTYCRREFAQRGIAFEVVQSNLSANHRRGTLRGLHYQRAPHAEAKLVSCVAGAIYDVCVDLRAGSPTRGRWLATTLRAGEARALFVPEGFAHGFQTLTDDTVVAYQMGDYHAPAAAGGVRYDDPELAIDWPIADAIVSDRDRPLPLLAAALAQ